MSLTLSVPPETSFCAVSLSTPVAPPRDRSLETKLISPRAYLVTSASCPLGQRDWFEVVSENLAGRFRRQRIFFRSGVIARMTVESAFRRGNFELDREITLRNIDREENARIARELAEEMFPLLARACYGNPATRRAFARELDRNAFELRARANRRALVY